MATKTNRPVLLLLLLAVALCGQLAAGQRDSDDDFDDAGFDDAGYNSPQNQDAEGSNQNPSNYSPSSEEDLDDDDDVDETHVRPQVAAEAVGQQQQQQQQQQRQRSASPQRFYDSPDSVLLANVDPAALNYNGHQPRYRRSLGALRPQAPTPTPTLLAPELDLEDSPASSAPLVRRKRHSKYIGPVYTYVKTDKHARFKWGVKHKVGKKHG